MMADEVKNTPIHSGHRKRLKEQFRTEGLDNFTEVQALELLLFPIIPRRDTNPIAHALLNQFGSFAQVLEAPVEELQKVDGIGEAAAVYLHMILDAGRYYQVSRSRHTKILTSLDKCGEYLVSFFYGQRVENIYLLCLDAKCMVLGCKKVGEGSVNSAGLSIRKIVEMALAANASAVVLAHNHPSGLAIPSDEDILTTRKVAAALSAVDVQLVDHIVVADNDYVSMVQSGFRMAD